MDIMLYKEDDVLILEYSSDSDWLSDEIASCENDDELQTLAKTFTFLRSDYIDEKDEEGYFFKFGVAEGNYYKIEKRKIGTEFDLYVNKNLDIDYSWFYCLILTTKYKNKKGEEKRTTKYGVLLHCFKDFYKNEALYFETDDYSDTAETGLHITQYTYRKFVEKFPSATNAKYYKLSVFTDILKDELCVDNYGDKFSDYLAKVSRKKVITDSLLPQESKKNDLAKFLYIKDALKDILMQAESGTIIHEDNFTKQIVELFTIINPKYIKVAEKINITDFTGARKTCQCDIALVDYGGNIDLIEVKHPTRYPNIFRKGDYRKHYVPCGELNGCINQLQQYLKSLTKMHSQELNDKNKNLVSSIGIDIKAIHPRGYIIFGRDATSFTGTEQAKKQKRIDFEIIRTMYNDVVDIITFDELLNRIERIITHLQA